MTRAIELASKPTVAECIKHPQNHQLLHTPQSCASQILDCGCRALYLRYPGGTDFLSACRNGKRKGKKVKLAGRFLGLRSAFRDTTLADLHLLILR